jgi:uncharacterized protein YbjQ (UPF0145 family)
MRSILPRDIAISTTPTLENHEITAYLDVANAHVVAGTGLFSDVAASFSDLFGGTSSSYQKQLRRINQQAIRELKKRAAEKGGNALVGLSVDHDQISGQGKQLLMVTASATIVRTQRLKSAADDEGNESAGVVTSRVVQVEEQKRRLLDDSRQGTLRIGDDTWDFLIENQIVELAGTVLETVKKFLGMPPVSRSDVQERFIERSRGYFLSLPEKPAKEQLYPALSTDTDEVREYALDLIAEGQFLDLRRIQWMLQDGTFVAQKQALAVLVEAEKPAYTERDVQAFEEITTLIEEGFEKRGEVIEVEESGMFSSDTKKAWQLPGSEPVAMDRDYDPKTGKDIYGFTREETRPEEALTYATRKITILQDQLS